MDRQKATGIAAGITLAAVGGVSAIVLTAGPSIAAAFNGEEPTAVSTESVSTETDPGLAEPTVVVIDENGNVVNPDNSLTSDADNNSDVGQAAAYDEDEYGEGEHYEDEHEDEDDDHDEDGDYENGEEEEEEHEEGHDEEGHDD